MQLRPAPQVVGVCNLTNPRGGDTRRTIRPTTGTNNSQGKILATRTTNADGGKENPGLRLVNIGALEATSTRPKKKRQPRAHQLIRNNLTMQHKTLATRRPSLLIPRELPAAQLYTPASP